MKKLTTIIALAVVSCLFMFSCANGSSDSTPAVTKTVYKATGSFSEYTQKTLTKLAYLDFPESSITNKDLVPDVFAARSTDPNETWYLSDDKIDLAIRTCLAGKTILFGAPSMTGLIAFGGRVTEVLDKEGNEGLKAENELSSISLYQMLNQFFNEQLKEEASDPSSYNQKLYDAVAIRNGDIYYVHKIGETYDTTAFTTSIESSEMIQIPQDQVKDTKVTTADTLHADDSSTDDYSTLEADSIQKFANWLSGKENPNAPSSDSRSLLDKYPEARAISNIENDPARKAQRFTHNFIAEADAYKRKENVEVLIDVWAYCLIDQKIDWYYIRTSVICNNQQLNFKNWWDDDKTTSSYFKECEIVSNLAKNTQTVRTNDCQPQNDPGSTTKTTGFNMQFGGNLGLAGSGPSGGLSGNFTFTNSESKNTPNISVKFEKNSNNRPDWIFKGQSIQGESGFLTTYCKNPPSIQTSQQAYFDTLSVFTLPSDYSFGYSKYYYVDLDTWIWVTLERLTGEYGLCISDSFIPLPYYGLKNHHYQKTTKVQYNDHIRKPCNNKGDYIMYFDSPEGSTPERIDLFTRELKEVIPSWDGSKTTIYAVGGDGNVDYYAKQYFVTIQDKITKNKTVLKSKGFEGEFKFYIKNANLDKAASSFTITF